MRKEIYAGSSKHKPTIQKRSGIRALIEKRIQEVGRFTTGPNISEPLYNPETDGDLTTFKNMVASHMSAMAAAGKLYKFDPKKGNIYKRWGLPEWVKDGNILEERMPLD